MRSVELILQLSHLRQPSALPDMAPVTPTQAGLRTGQREKLQIQGDIRILRPHRQQAIRSC
jgi:hypothetical protein